MGISKDFDFCPGARNIRQPRPDYLKCPHCGEEVEIWSDEVKTICPSCKKIVLADREGMSCLEWCSYAEQCVGAEVYQSYFINRSALLKEKLVSLLDEVGKVEKNIQNNLQIALQFAEQLLKVEKGDWQVVFSAIIAYYFSDAVSPDTISRIFPRAGISKSNTEKVLEIVSALKNQKKLSWLDFKICHDAIQYQKIKSQPQLFQDWQLKELFLTDKGYQITRQLIR